MKVATAEVWVGVNVSTACCPSESELGVPSSANQLLADINAGKGGLGMIAKDPQFAAKLRDTVDKLDSVLNRVDSGEGTVGQLVRNPSLYNNLDQSLTETRGLIAAIRENPKKYLTFHVKIF